MVKGILSVLQRYDNVYFVERRVEDIGPQGPSVVGNVVVADDREKGVEDFVISRRNGIFGRIFPVDIVELVFFDKVLFDIPGFGFLQQGEGTPTWGLASLPRGEKTWALLTVEGRIKCSTHHRL